jgi:hypothetical protein
LAKLTNWTFVQEKYPPNRFLWRLQELEKTLFSNSFSKVKTRSSQISRDLQSAAQEKDFLKFVSENLTPILLQYEKEQVGLETRLAHLDARKPIDS